MNLLPLPFQLCQDYKWRVASAGKVRGDGYVEAPALGDGFFGKR